MFNLNILCWWDSCKHSSVAFTCVGAYFSYPILFRWMQWIRVDESQRNLYFGKHYFRLDFCV